MDLTVMIQRLFHSKNIQSDEAKIKSWIILLKDMRPDILASAIQHCIYHLYSRRTCFKEKAYPEVKLA